MKPLNITPATLRGNIQVPPSKSLLHRYILAAALAEGESNIKNFMLSQDISATLDAVCAMQVPFDIREDCIIIKGKRQPPEHLAFSANESGSTLRFMIPVALAVSGSCEITGAARLFERHLEPYFALFQKQGIAFQQKKNALHMQGRLQPDVISLPGDISSQFVTGLLFALPLLPGDSEIIVTTPLESKDYVELTLSVLNTFGVRVEHENYQHYWIKGNQVYHDCDAFVESDFSQAAFFLVAGALGNQVACTGLNIHSLQGDRRILEVLQNCGATVSAENGTVTCTPGRLSGISVDCSQIPDLVPILAVLFSFCEGESRITNVWRLRFKESDRLHAITKELCRLGAKIEEREDALLIQGVRTLSGGRVESHNDHRIAMSLAIAATRATGELLLDGPACVQKSMPQFFEEYTRLGGKAVE